MGENPIPGGLDVVTASLENVPIIGKRSGGHRNRTKSGQRTCKARPLFVWLILRWSVVKPTRGCWATAGTIGRSDPLDGCCDPLDGCCDPLDGCCNPLTASAATSVVCCFTPSALPKNRLAGWTTIIDIMGHSVHHIARAERERMVTK